MFITFCFKYVYIIFISVLVILVHQIIKSEMLSWHLAEKNKFKVLFICLFSVSVK